jgi:hypothetical protein
MTDHRRFHLLPLTFALLSLTAACGTEQFGPDDVIIGTAEPAPGQGSFMIAYAPTVATYQEEQALEAMTWDPPLYNVTMDGKVLAQGEPTEGSTVLKLLPISVEEHGIAEIGYLDAGSHHFAVLAPGRPPIYQGDGEIMPGGELRLFLFGAAGAEQGRFVFIPDPPSPGNESITVINLMGSGQPIEVVTCTEATACTPISPALAMGDVFQTEVPALVSADGFGSLTADGAGIGYRVIPSASSPNPTVMALYVGSLGAGARLPGDTSPPTPIFIAAPFFMTDQGLLPASGFN